MLAFELGLNRYKVTKSNPLHDKYCSASWRVNKTYLGCEGFDEDEINILNRLLDTDELFYPSNRKKIPSFIRDLLNAAFGSLNSQSDKTLIHGHTIGDEEAKAFRSEFLSAFRRQKNPCPTWQMLS